MKKLNTNEMQNLNAGYCDATIYHLTGICTNAGCLAATAWNLTLGTLGFDPMACAQ